MCIDMLANDASKNADCPAAPMSVFGCCSAHRNPLWRDHHVFTSLPFDRFDILVPALGLSYAAAVEEAFWNGQLDGCKIDGLLWVAESDLFELAGPGADADNLEGGCFIPHEARKRNIAREQRRRYTLAKRTSGPYLPHITVFGPKPSVSSV